MLLEIVPKEPFLNYPIWIYHLSPAGPLTDTRIFKNYYLWSKFLTYNRFCGLIGKESFQTHCNHRPAEWFRRPLTPSLSLSGLPLWIPRWNQGPEETSNANTSTALTVHSIWPRIFQLRSGLISSSRTQLAADKQSNVKFKIQNVKHRIMKPSGSYYVVQQLYVMWAINTTSERKQTRDH